MNFNDKTILITGGTGSFGKKFIKTVLKEHNPKTIRVFSRGEFLQQETGEEIKDERLRFLIGDIRDKERLHRAMNGVDIVIHAAALKQVCTCGYNPIEAIKTNILGTANVIDAAIDNNIEKAIFISTDKAVNPVNIYGATKLCAEKLFIQANSYTGERRTKFSCCRYGNVAGSRGSVVPLFLEQKEKGALTITDKRMTRFWLTLQQGVDFSIECLKRMQGGEIFIPKIPSIKMLDLAEIIAPNAEIKVIGIRPEEKLHESLLTSEEARHSKEFDKYFVIEPEHSFWEKVELEGDSISDNFNYSSDNNNWWLTKEELKSIVDNLDS